MSAPARLCERSGCLERAAVLVEAYARGALTPFATHAMCRPDARATVESERSPSLEMRVVPLRERRDVAYPSVPAGSCPVCLGTLPCPCVQAYGDPATLGATDARALPAYGALGCPASETAPCSDEARFLDVHEARWGRAGLQAIARDGISPYAWDFPSNLDRKRVQELAITRLGGEASAQADAEIDAIEAAALERVRDRSRDVRTQRAGTTIAFEPFEPNGDRKDNACKACKGQGGELEYEDDGTPYSDRGCRLCGGTGDRVHCDVCLGGYPRVREPGPAHAAAFSLTVQTDAGAVVRLCCEDAEHLGTAVRDVVDAARRQQQQIEQARADNARLRAAIEADASREPL